uniref:PPE family protein n=1 Tax=Mycobacterium sp. HUMS_1102779 TaxID=3383487 RepID=UPI00389A1FD2
MRYSVSPPEVNSGRMFSGPGSGPTLAAANAWEGLAADLRSAAASFRSVTADVADRWWRGPSSVAMGAVAAAYAAWLQTTGEAAEQTATQARAVAGAFESALAATADPAAVAVNRARLLASAASNVFGQNAPVVAALDAEYERMWAQDVAAMAGYHTAASAAAAQVTPWQPMRITVPGASPGWLAGVEALRQYADWNAAIGENWLPGTVAQIVNYPATAGLISGLTAPSANASFAIGQQVLNHDIFSAVAAGHPVVVAGFSEGTIVIDHEQAYLAGLANAPSPSMLSFVEFANPERGLAATFLPAGITIPGMGYTVGTAPVSQYNTSVVYSQYEGWADPPNRPWNLPADLNALAGAEYLHWPTELASPSQVVEVSSVTNALGGTTTTYMVPTPILPILMPLQQIGVAAPIVGDLNAALTPLVDAGYSQYDPTGGPYLSHGSLVW